MRRVVQRTTNTIQIQIIYKFLQQNTQEKIFVVIRTSWMYVGLRLDVSLVQSKEEDLQHIHT